MPVFNVQVFQSFHLHRRIVVRVEAEDMDAAIEKQAESDAPAYDDPGWWESLILENEEVTEPEPRGSREPG